MTEWNGPAFVLRVGHFREIDIWLKLLVPGQGLITAFAFGGAKSRHRFSGCLDVLNTLSCRIKTARKGGFFTLEEATLISHAGVLRSNVRRMGIAANCLRFVEALGVEPAGSEEIFCLVEKMRGTLADAPEIASLFPLFFRLQLASRQGYAVAFKSCGLCGRSLPERAFFLVNEGQMVCSTCRAELTGSAQFQIPLTRRERLLLSHVQENPPNLWSDGSLAPEERRSCSMAIDGFIQYHLGIVWDRGTFRKV